MACFPIAIHASISCVLGLGYGCGYVTALSGFAFFHKKPNSKSDISSNIPAQADPKSNVQYSIQDLVNTLDDVKHELQYNREKLEMYENTLDNAISKIESNNYHHKRWRTKSF